MFRDAHPQRIQEVADRLAQYFANSAEPLVAMVKAFARQGMRICVAHEDTPSVGICFHVDELDNGAHGFKDEGLKRIWAYRDDMAYVPPTPKPGLVYDDVITHGNIEPNLDEVAL